MPHNFWKSLEYENSKSQVADDFYYHQFKIENRIRFNTGSESDMEFQLKDIDVQLYGWNRYTNVSEKFREVDYNDLYLELYSMYPTVKGWMHKSEANHLAYFFPQRMLWIKEKEIQQVFKDFIEPSIDLETLNLWLEKNPKKSGRYASEIIFENRKYPVFIIVAYNKTQNKNWNTVGVSVPFDLLKAYQLNWKEYSL
ncbi:MAG: hypothetical protein CL840_17480 [Crocinitomicaceae bacterium]|nr:hypothetical protein [Crocinitomicaceae bacterium]|tara:strand:+ start:20147 stop:20737 length:591 start_codon:yes stop_codon:yes gene_type:complete